MITESECQRLIADAVAAEAERCAMKCEEYVAAMGPANHRMLASTAGFIARRNAAYAIARAIREPKP